MWYETPDGYGRLLKSRPNSRSNFRPCLNFPFELSLSGNPRGWARSNGRGASRHPAGILPSTEFLSTYYDTTEVNCRLQHIAYLDSLFTSRSESYLRYDDARSYYGECKIAFGEMPEDPPDILTAS